MKAWIVLMLALSLPMVAVDAKSIKAGNVPNAESLNSMLAECKASEHRLRQDQDRLVGILDEQEHQETGLLTTINDLLNERYLLKDKIDLAIKRGDRYKEMWRTQQRLVGTLEKELAALTNVEK